MNKYHVVSFSGGKDSTAMLLRMLELKMPMDEIIFCDTGVEFPAMYEHVDKVEKYIGRKINRISAKKSYKYYLLEYQRPAQKRQYSNDRGYGWARPKQRWCTWEMKKRIVGKHIQDKQNIVQYVGIAADEQRRIKNQKYPLIEWGWTEADCLRYCKEKGFDWGGLYDIFHRVSCWCCPLQSLDELRKLRKYFPELWSKLQDWDKKTWNDFRMDYSAADLELRFSLEEEWAAEGRDWKTNLPEFLKEYRLRKSGWEQVKLFG